MTEKQSPIAEELQGEGGNSSVNENQELSSASTRTLRAAQGDGVATRPRIICLCGSTRFIETFAIKTWELEREGYIVLGCTLLPMWYCEVPSHFGEQTGTKEQCDELHKRKIDLADEVLILDVDGYIGESTRSEIEYATATGKPVRYLSTEQPSISDVLANPDRGMIARPETESSSSSSPDTTHTCRSVGLGSRFCSCGTLLATDTAGEGLSSVQKEGRHARLVQRATDWLAEYDRVMAEEHDGQIKKQMGKMYGNTRLLIADLLTAVNSVHPHSEGGEGAVVRLIKHTHHGFDCNKRVNGAKCDCGLDDAKANALASQIESEAATWNKAIEAAADLVFNDGHDTLAAIIRALPPPSKQE